MFNAQCAMLNVQMLNVQMLNAQMGRRAVDVEH
jgi:hypothetical protein